MPLQAQHPGQSKLVSLGAVPWPAGQQLEDKSVHSVPSLPAALLRPANTARGLGQAHRWLWFLLTWWGLVIMALRLAWFLDVVRGHHSLSL